MMLVLRAPSQVLSSTAMDSRFKRNICAGGRRAQRILKYVRDGNIANQIGPIRFCSAQELRGVESEALQLVQASDCHGLPDGNWDRQSTQVNPGRAAEADFRGDAIAI